MDRFKKSVAITIIGVALMVYGVIFLFLPANEWFLWLGFVLTGASAGLLPVGLFGAFRYAEDGKTLNVEEEQ